MSSQNTTPLNDDFDKEPEINLQTIKVFSARLWPYIRRYQKLFFMGLLFIMISIATSLALPWLLGKMVDEVFVPKALQFIFGYAFVFFILSAIKSASTFAQTYVLTNLGQNVLHDMRQDLFKQYLYYPISEFARTPTGRMVTRLINDTSALQDLFTGGIAVALADALIILGMIVWMIVLYPSLGLICISVFPLMMFASIHYGAKLRGSFRQSRAALSRLNSFLAENISGMWLIQLLNKQERFKKKFDTTSQAFTHRQLQTVENFSIFQPMITILSALSMSLLIWYGGYLSIHEKKITLGVLVAFMSYIQAMYSPIRDITEKFNLFVSALASCEKIFEFMDRQTESNTKMNGNRFISPVSNIPLIEFKNVSFKYQTSTAEVLKNISFTVGSAEKIGIVGHTGAGKTTITQILLRFYDEYSGSILFAGKELNTIEKKTVRSQIGYIQQEPFLFSGTIADNIFLWDEEKRKKFNSFPDFIKNPFQQDSLSLLREVVERGNNLSAGERQMISYMRAMVYDPLVLILDEATAHVDLLTEQWIKTASDYFFKNRTVLIIAHRLATLKGVDRIFVFHQGELVELGTHRELLAKKDVYYKLSQIQSKREQILSTI